MATPCSNDPNEVVAKVVSAKANAEKFDKFVNGTNVQTVQLGSGDPTPTIRNAVRQVMADASWAKSFIANAPEGDVSLNNVTAWGTQTSRTLADRFADSITAKDFGAKGDGATDDTDAFAAFENYASGRFVNLCGSTYVVETVPNKNIYYNGFFKVDDITTEALNIKIYIKEAELVGTGLSGRAHFIAGNRPETFDETLHSLISIGTDACENLNPDLTCSDVIAIGDGVMSEGHPGHYNIGIGLFALHNVNSTANDNGDRNIGIGSLSLQSLTTGRHNVCLGRDSGQPITTGSDNTCLGYASMGGYCYKGLLGKIEPKNPVTGTYNTFIGNFSGGSTSGDSSYNTLLGYGACRNVKKHSINSVIGCNSLAALGYYQSINGKELTHANDTGTYSQNGTTITISVSGHSAVAGRYVNITFTSGAIKTEYTNGDPSILYVSSVLDSNSFTIASPVSMSASGNCTITEYEQADDFAGGTTHNVCIGAEANLNAYSCNNSVVVGVRAGIVNSTDVSNECKFSTIIGESAGRNAKKIDRSEVYGNNAGNGVKELAFSTIIGYSSCNNSNVNKVQNTVAIGATALASTTDTTVDCATFVGYGAGKQATAVAQSCAFGWAAGSRPSKLEHCTAIGALSMYSTADTTNLENSTALGYQAVVTGSNQVQLGNSATTTYAYGAVQNRSDARDKTDIRDTELGLEFLLALRPVDFKWDFREDYDEYVQREDGTIETMHHEKDGSRKRNRFHHGLIAQEVKAVLDEKDIDFGGYQDHKINGGKDVLSLGYEEFIAPIIRSIQEIDSRLKALEA